MGQNSEKTEAKTIEEKIKIKSRNQRRKHYVKPVSWQPSWLRCGRSLNHSHGFRNILESSISNFFSVFSFPIFLKFLLFLCVFIFFLKFIIFQSMFRNNKICSEVSKKCSQLKKNIHIFKNCFEFLQIIHNFKFCSCFAKKN